MGKAIEQANKEFKHLSTQVFACEQDAHKALEQWRKKQNLCDVQAQIIEIPVYAKKGRPLKNEAPSRIDYQISGNLFACLEKRRQALTELGLFILSTNDLDPQLSMHDVLTHYKAQQSVERGFRFLKSPDFSTDALF